VRGTELKWFRLHTTVSGRALVADLIAQLRLEFLSEGKRTAFAQGPVEAEMLLLALIN
jgi:hypothetical protein